MRPTLYLLATALSICVSVAADIAVSPARAASPYVVDGVALGAAFKSTRAYQCSPSEQFAEYTWCRRTRQERGRRGTFSKTNSILHSPSGVAYISREIRPAFFAENDIESEIRRLSARFGAAGQELRLPQREGVSTAVIVVWGGVELEVLEGSAVAALQSSAMSAQGMFVDHLGDIPESIRLGLPVYRLQGGPGYLWSAMSDAAGRGSLRFLAIDGLALTRPKDAGPANQVTEAAASKVVKEAAALSAPPHRVAPAVGNDLHAFLTPQPTSALGKEAGKPTRSRGQEAPQLSVVPKTRADGERARLMDAERMAAEDREKARLAWVRFEAETAASDANARLKWIVLASLFTLAAVLVLLRRMARRPEQQPLRIGRPTKNLPSLMLVWIEFGCDLLARLGACLVAVVMRIRAMPSGKSVLVTHGHS